MFVDLGCDDGSVLTQHFAIHPLVFDFRILRTVRKCRVDVKSLPLSTRDHQT